MPILTHPLRCEVNDEVLQLIPIGIVVFIIPKIVFACSGRTAATAAIPEGVTSKVGMNFGNGIDKQRTLCFQFLHPNFRLYICPFLRSVLLYLITTLRPLLI